MSLVRYSLDRTFALDGPRYMRSCYVRFCVFATEKMAIFAGAYSLIYSNVWSFYMRIRYMQAYFLVPFAHNGGQPVLQSK